ncbi:hypothetical protein BDF21DRAFT_372621 [Thamnidium elegans]|uniref:C2H2-type domain-containing protein n=1 Tax=Thamnidium elegans TaxID=101142 RepID=A0A8H7T0Y7_9FUNG|nr:hypothetical protein INT48_002617 [Thamnidium elegans]KAI8048240.1 hypothetical protein BDF21DRAFT_372621 [Thamnidium elegans]
MAQSSTMFPFNSTSNETTSLLERRQQSAPFLQQLELPSLPPLAQIMTENPQEKKAQVEAVAVTMAAIEAAATASMITSTAQPLMQHDNTHNLTSAPTTFLPTTYNTITDTPVNTILPIYSSSDSLNQTLVENGVFMDQQQHMFNAAAVAAGLTTDNSHQLLSMPPSFMDNGRQQQRESSVSSTCSDNKVYSFVAIPGTNQRKRPRRRYDEIERLYHCSWTGCTKAYGTLNHLNAHVSMQQHGPKRHPTEFKEMRKEWRRQKKERDSVKKQVENAYRNNQQQQMMQTYPSFANNGYSFY